MKRYLTSGMIIVAAIAVTLLWHMSVRADNTLMTEAHIDRIRGSCVEAQSSLSQLHASDALLRVNRGQLYESISTKLMAPLNSRVALNRLDGATLVSVAADYERQLADFRLSYQQYEEAMSRTLRINCVNQPVAFYDSVGDTRTKRKQVHDTTVALHNMIRNYKNVFEAFAKKFQESGQ